MRSDSASHPTLAARRARPLSRVNAAYRMRIAAVAMAILLAPAVAGAQTATPSSAVARALYGEGLQLQQAGNWDEACPKFEEAYRIEKRVASGFHIAECHEHYGRTATAWALFADMVTLAQQQDRASQATEAQAKADALLPRLLKLRVVVTDASDSVQIAITRGGQLLFRGRSDVAIPIDPGVCHIEVSAPAHVPATREVDVQGVGTTVSETFSKLEPVSGLKPGTTPPPSAPPPAPITPSAPEPPAVPNDGASDELERGAQQRTLGVVVGSAGLAALGVGTVFGIMTLSKTAEAEDYCPSRDACFDEGADLMDEAATTATVSTALFAVGGAALVAGVITYFIAPASGPDEARSPASHFAVVPILSREALRLSLQGAW